MSSLESIMNSTSISSNFDEYRWVIQIRRALEEELDKDTDHDIPVSIFNVPRQLVASDPDSYIPQIVALGPYHYWRPELYEMQRYKLATAKRTQKQLHLLETKFEHLVDQLTKLESNIRASYHKYLDFNGETLAWMMAVDASFLLEFLRIYAIREGKILNRVPSSMSHLVDVAGRKSAHNTILRDLVMIENQIPMFLLRKVLEFQFSSLELADEMLLSMLMGLCKELSPFMMLEEFPQIEVSEKAHLLDFLYHVMVPPVPKSEEEQSDEIIGGDDDDQSQVSESKEGYFGKFSFVKRFFHEVWKLLSKMNRLIRVMIKTILCVLPGFKLLKLPTEYLFSPQHKSTNPENENSTPNNFSLVEEITIPSVVELSKSGVCFSPTNGSILTVNFDATTATFHLPTVRLEVNTEVILRNLVAYEACNASGPLIFTRYTELMNGIVDTEEDAKLLRRRGVILNHLKSDGEVAKLWNGMSKSIRLTKVPFLDKVIEDVNKYYNGRWRVKLGKFIKEYVFQWWKFLVLVVVVLVLLLMSLQAFCSVYGWGRLFRSTSAK